MGCKRGSVNREDVNGVYKTTETWPTRYLNLLELTPPPHSPHPSAFAQTLSPVNGGRWVKLGWGQFEEG